MEEDTFRIRSMTIRLWLPERRKQMFKVWSWSEKKEPKKADDTRLMKKEETALLNGKTW